MFRTLLLVLVPGILSGSLLFLGDAARAQPATPAKGLILKNVTLYTAIGDQPIENGTLVVKDGKFLQVGDADLQDLKAEQFEVRDMKGAVVIPGLVDTHSHIGVWARPHVPANSDGNEMSGPVQSGVRAIDALQPDDPGIRMAVAGGITTANVMPGSGNVIGGQTLYVKLRGRTVEEMRILGELPDGAPILGGLKMANGENPKGYGKNKQQAPFTRMKVAALQREQFVKAKEYKAKKDAGEKVERDVSLEPLVEVLEKKRTVHFHCHRADDLMTAVRIAEEFGFELVLQHATEGYRVADILAKKKIPVSLTLVDSPGGKAEVMGLLEENAAILEKAGVAVTINTDDSVTESRFYLRTGAIAVRGGMSEMSALKALTITPAKLLHLDHRIGSLQRGKDADFVVLGGQPFSTYTHVLETYIDGKRVFDAADPAQIGYRDGGFALPSKERVAIPNLENIRHVQENGFVRAFNGSGEEGKTMFAVVADFVHTASDRGTYKNAVIVVKNGEILYVGHKSGVSLKGVRTITAKHVTPGLIDAFAMSGLSGAWNIPADQDQDELSDPNQSDLRALDGFNPHEPLLEFLRANGTTIVHAAPGRANVLAGQSGLFRTEGLTAESCTLRSTAAILVNLGEVPKDAYKGKGPLTRMGVAALVRKAFADADAYRQKKPAGPKNAKHEALIPALEGKAPVYFAAHRADDISTALRIAAEFNLKPVIALGTEAYRMAGDLKKAGVPVIVHPTMQRAAASMETLHAFVGNAAILAQADVPFAICTGFEGYVPKNRVLRHEAAMAAANGLGPDRALRAVTIDAARILGIEMKYGSIEKGKAADLVLYDGDPFEHATHVTTTLMKGEPVFSRSDYLKLPFERRILPLLGGGGGAGCCMGSW